ncbi:putative disease resistance protein [Vigna angularis]|uniref:Putative disease resistance protein n=1 Tax=Phaseolus angularis TaxID=3914 RepID=A0A8T0KZ29_PHAAN|nr:putative disease resistance protein [Vigna angularis]
MAEYFVFDIAESLVRKLASFVCEEASRVYEVYDDVKGIKDTLSIVKGVLLDAEQKKEHRHGLREWIRQIQTVCLDAQDVLDGLDCQNVRKQFLKASGSTRMKVGHFFSPSNSLVFRFQMARQIKNIRRRLDKIAADGNKFGLERIEVDRRLVQRREMTYSHVDASGVIGRESDREEIIKLLMQPHPHGDGYGDQSILINIINSASVSASATTTAIAHQENIKNFDIEQLQTVLKLKLSGQKYFLVLDDIWNDNRAKWTELKDLIKVGGVGSKILVTTRSNSIASMMGTVPSYVLEGLSMENCYALAEILILWESLGLLQSFGGNRKLENVARQYIDELHARSFLEDFEDFGYYYYFKVHDLVHDLALFVAKEELLMVNSFTRYIPEQIRHLSVVENDSLNHVLFPKSNRLLLRREQLAFLEVLVIQSCGSLQLLPLHVLPKLEVLIVSRCEMLNLNYESSIHRLRMKFLHLEHCPKMHTLPQWVEGSVDTLRTLLILNCHSLEMFPEWLKTMSSLKRLHIVNCHKLLCLPSEMHSLTALDDLTIEGCPELCRKCEPQNGEYWSFINHIKRVSIGETRKGKLLVRMLQQMRLRLRDQ